MLLGDYEALLFSIIFKNTGALTTKKSISIMGITTNFGAVAEIYDQTRPRYAQQLMDYVVSFCQGRVLDVGCGTGIATRQLAERGVRVIGCDGDARMIAVARSYQQPSIDYFLGSAEELPFGDETFDVVTAFSAFHWFSDTASVDGIKDVLKKNGLFIVSDGINKHNDDDYFKHCVEEVIKRKLPEKRKRDVEEVFRSNGIEQIARQDFQYELEYTIDKYLLYMQSRGYWNKVYEQERQRVLDHARERFNEKYSDNKVPVQRHYAVVVGKVV